MITIYKTRLQCKDLLESLIERWDQERADIPAHYNHDLKED